MDEQTDGRTNGPVENIVPPASLDWGDKLGRSFLLAFHSNYGFILHHIRDKATYRPKIVICFIPPCIRHPR